MTLPDGRGSTSLLALISLSSAALFTIGCENRVAPPTTPAPTESTRPQPSPPHVPFADVTAAAGLAGFVHETGAAGDKLLPETMGGGAGFFDYDSDGDADLLLVNSSRWPRDEPPADAAPARSRLYRNDGTGRFDDVTAGSGLDLTLYGMGCACGDYDGDGAPDVYLTALGENRLFRNAGGGRFVDVTAETGTAGPAAAWTTAAGWFDADGDGDLDLLALNYLDWTAAADRAQPFTLTGSERGYGRPRAFGGTVPLLYRNDGGGRFTEVAEVAGLHVLNPATGEPLAKSLGLTFADADADGDLDILIANDTVRDFLFLNRTADGEPGRFVEAGIAAGIAFDERGAARGGMGIDAAPLRNDATLAVVIGNFSTEMTALYTSRRGEALFADDAAAAGLGAATRPDLTFGLLWSDADLDGRPDLITANGHLEPEIARAQPGVRYAQPPRLFWNAGPRAATEFVPLGVEQTGPAFARPIVGRAVAGADVDLDGDPDYLFTSLGGPPRLFRNDQTLGRHWLRVTVRGDGFNTGAIGATVAATAGGRTRTQTVNPTRGYLTQVELPLTFGLGEAETVETLRVVWPDGTTRTLENVAADRAIVVPRPKQPDASTDLFSPLLRLGEHRGERGERVTTGFHATPQPSRAPGVRLAAGGPVPPRRRRGAWRRGCRGRTPSGGGGRAGRRASPRGAPTGCPPARRTRRGRPARGSGGTAPRPGRGAPAG